MVGVRPQKCFKYIWIQAYLITDDHFILLTFYDVSAPVDRLPYINNNNNYIIMIMGQKYAFDVIDWLQHHACACCLSKIRWTEAHFQMHQWRHTDRGAWLRCGRTSLASRMQHCNTNRYTKEKWSTENIECPFRMIHMYTYTHTHIYIYLCVWVIVYISNET